MDQPDRADEEEAIIEEACSLIATRTDSTVEEATRGLHADAEAFGMPIAEVAEDVLDAARAPRRTQPSTLSGWLATATPRHHQDH